MTVQTGANRGEGVQTDAQVPFRMPHSPEAEASVVGELLRNEKAVGEIVGTLLEPDHFYLPGFKALYRAIVDAYYAEEPTDALTIAELCAKTLSRTWKCEEDEAISRVQQLAAGQRNVGAGVAHARLVKRDADYRALLDLNAEIQRRVSLEQESPEEIAGIASQTAMLIATSTLLTHEIVSFEELGQRFIRQQKVLMAARQQGVELGAYFGLSFLDSFMRGLQPTELLIVAGEPGAGKSAVTWTASQKFAERQMKKPPAKRLGTLILSLEMGEEPSNVRLAQTITGIDGGLLREGRTDPTQLRKIASEWNKRRDIPLHFNFTSTLKASQLRALVVEAIRKHDIALVVIDHMRYFDMDGRWQNKLEEEEAKARFLKEDIAKALNLAVVVLAHTVKSLDDDGRPSLRHLRGSQMVAAHADFVAFVYRPYNHAKREDIDEGRVQRTDAEMIWAKNRHGLDGTARFHFDPSTMNVY